VIAVNPYKWIDGLYGDHLHEQYLKKDRDSLSPHVYSTSTAAYKHMTKNEMNQSILVSGESGAGKTETTKIVMNHLASVAGGRMDKTIAKVIDVNPLLESFGNAKTTRNDNSSRFGKFTLLQFNDRGKLIGAKCDTYLLEKSRVVSIAEGERNYHIFYQMLAGLSPRELLDIELDPKQKYKYIGELSEMKIPGMDDSKWLESTKKSLALIGLDTSAQKTLFQILAGVLVLGEITFSESGESGSAISSEIELSQVARLFGLPTGSIQQALCNRTVITRNDSVTVPLDPMEAVENRDALAKTIYSKMFDWMVQKINQAISGDESIIRSQIGVLDIFGFEDFAQNGFEQFCINYANEKLQQKFTTDVFKTVEDEYVREGLEWDHIQYQDNKDIVEVIDGKMGIIALMNDHLRQPRGTEEALVNKFKTNHQKKGDEVNPHIDFPKVKRTQFIINHYAGAVTYETVGFMEKHRDTLQKDLLDLLQASSISMLVDLFDDSESMTDSGGARGKAGMAVKSLGSQFKMSLTQLMENISATNTHYVRCIKPNSNKSPTEFNKRMVVEQLRSAGVIEAIRITRSGYPSRLTPDELASRYCIMFPPSMHSKDVRRTCSVFMSAIGRKAPLEYQMGKTLIYFKNGVMEELEAMKSDFMYVEATCIQKIALGFIYRRRMARMVRAAIVLQSYARMSIERKEYYFQRRAIRKIQRAWRRYKSVPSPYESDDDGVSEFDDSFVGHGANQRRNTTEDDGGQWVDEIDEDEEYNNTSNPARPASRSVMDRIRAFKSNVGGNGRTDSSASEFLSERASRIGDLSSRARSIMGSTGGGSIVGGGNMSLEEENAMLRIENRNLKYDLELMREQCIELQAIILEINKSRKR
jgi:myosin V